MRRICSLTILILIVLVSISADAEWVKGDAHIHTRFSKWDWAYNVGFKEGPSVEEQVKAAKERGLKWIIFTEHEEMLQVDIAKEAAEGKTNPGRGQLQWREEQSLIRAAEAKYGILVMLGEEVGSAISLFSDGHLLACNIDHFIYQGSYRPLKDYQQRMINLVKEAEPEIAGIPPLSFIAHPKGEVLKPDFPWEEGVQNVSGYTGIEILNGGEVRVDEEEWDSLLMQGKKIVAIGNSDAHWPRDIGRSFTWLDIQGPLTHRAVYQALRDGRAVASSRPWLTFEVNNKGLGEQVSISGEAQIKISWDAEDSLLHQIDIIYNGQVIKTFGGQRSPDIIINDEPAPLEIREVSPLFIELSLPESGYLRVRAKSFSIAESLQWYYAYTNPIWIEVVQPESALLQPQVLFLNLPASIKDDGSRGYQKIADLARDYSYLVEEREWKPELELSEYALIFFTGDTEEEVDSLRFIEYIEEGGTLVLLGELGPWNQRAREVLNQISEPLGIHFNSDLLCDPTDHYGWLWNADPAIPRIRKFLTGHWLTKGLSSLWVAWGSSLSVEPSALVIAKSDEDSWGDLNPHYDQEKKELLVVQEAGEMKGPLPFIALAQRGQGRLIALGDSSLWDNSWFISPSFWFKADNNQLAQNIFEYTLDKFLSREKQNLTFDKEGLDVIFIIDHSGSMADPVNQVSSLQKFFVAQEAIREFATFLEPKDCVSIIGFEEVAEVRMGLQYYHPFLLERGISSLPLPDGATNISQALELAYQQMEFSISGNKSKLIILLTDGDYNRGVNPLRVVQTEWPIYTIGLGSGTSFNEALLKELAHLTGGQYKHASSAQELGDFYATLALQARGASTVLRWRDYINQDQVVEHTVKIEEEAERVNFILNWGGSRLGFEVLGPQRAKSKEGANYIIYQLQNPPPGEWRLRIRGREVPAEGEQYLLSTTLQSEIQTNLTPFKSSYALGEPIEIGLQVSEAGATASVQIQRPDGIIESLVLREEREGFLVNRYFKTDSLGSYLIKVEVRYPQFKREIEELVMVGAIDQVYINQTSLLPQPETVLADSSPLIQARLSGPAGKIKKETLELKVDNRVVVHQYDAVNQIVSHQVQLPLDDGKHRVVLSVNDFKVEWSFEIDTQAEIKSVKIEPQAVKAGEEAVVLLKAEPQGQAELEIQGVVSGLSFAEVKPGIYQASFKPREGIEEEERVLVSFKDRVGNSSRDDSQRILIDTLSPQVRIELEGEDNIYQNGEILSFSVFTEEGAQVVADLSELEEEKTELELEEVEEGVFRGVWKISYQKGERSGIKRITISVRDRAGNLTQSSFLIYLHSRSKEFALLQNYPNPFKEGTWIPFQLPQKSRVKIRIFNQRGNLVQVLDLGEKEAGYYLEKERAIYWPARNNQGEAMARGIYFYELKGVIRKMVKVR